MNLSLNDLDSDVAQRLSENPRFAELHAASASASALWGPDAHQMPIQQKVAVVVPSVLGGLCLAYLFFSGQIRLATVLASVIAAIFFVSVAYLAMYWQYLKRRLKRLAATSLIAPTAIPKRLDTSRSNMPLALTDVRDASRFLSSLPRFGQIYMESVIALWEAAENQTLAETEARDLLQQMNDLLQSVRALEAQEAKLDRLGDAAVTAQLAKERNALAVRVFQTADAAARESLAQSLALCETRLAQAREIAPLRERIGAQRELAPSANCSPKPSRPSTRRFCAWASPPPPRR